MIDIHQIKYFQNRLKLRTHVIRFVFFLAALIATILVLRINGMLPSARAAATIQNSDPVATVSAASFVGSPAPLAPNSIVAAFGTQLATGTQIASSQPLPTSLLNTTVTVNGVDAPLFFVSPGQVNYLIPSNVSAGDAEVIITSTQGNGDQIISRGPIKIAQTAPAIFTANANGIGAPAAVTGRVNENGQFVFDPTPPFEPDPLHPGLVVPAPIDVGTNDRPAFLILFGTGLRNALAGSARAVIGGVDVPVTPVAAPGFTGLDQINLPIPVSLKGSGIVDVTLVINGVSSNTAKVNLAGTPTGAMTITGFSVTDPALAGQTVTIQGTGFVTTPDQNTVRFGAAQARVIAATASQLTVIVPFGAESGRVTVQTAQGEARSNDVFRVQTSVSGIVQSTGSTSSPPVPLENVTVRLVGTTISVRTNPQGTFVMAGVSPGISQIEIDGSTTNNDPPFPRVTLKATVNADRDNQFAQPISLQQITGGSGTVGGGPGFSGGSQSIKQSSEFLTVLKQKFPSPVDRVDNQQFVYPTAAQPIPGPAKTVVISNRGVTLEVPIGTGVRFPDGKTAGQMRLTVLEGSRLPGINLPVGVFSQTICQITPLGSLFSPGASLSFPNPDQTNLGPGAKVDLYRFDVQSGAFIKRGTGTVSADRLRVVSDGRIVDLASFWFAAAPGGVTTVTGRVVNSLSLPVPGAILSINGRSAKSDQNGGFNIPDVATTGLSQIQVEAVLPQQFGTSPRGTSALTTVVVGGITNVGAIALSATRQAGLVLSPFVIDLASNSAPTKVDVTLTQPAPSGGLLVGLESKDTEVVTVPANVTIAEGQTTASFNVTRVGPGVAPIRAFATLSGSLLETFAVVTVSAPAPVLNGVSPQAAPPRAPIVISGAGFVAGSDSNFIGFVRNGELVAIANPDDNEIVRDPSGNIAVRVRVPLISPGPVNIVAAVVDDFSGIISDISVPIGFTVLALDVSAPQLANVQPAQGNPRDQVTINGSGFSQNPLENQVVFRQGFNESEARIIRATATSLFVEVPAYLISKGPATIVARRISPSGATTNASNALNFTITADPAAPVTPTLASVVNANTGGASGRDGDVIRATGTGFGRNFINLDLEDLGNDEPLISLLLFYQNNQLINFAIPLSASGGTQLTSVVPTGLAQGPAQITIVTFDLETGFVSDESAPVTFNITVGSLLRFDEDEPNDSFATATKVFLQSIIDGSTAEDDPFDIIIVFIDGTIVPVPDLFLLSLDQTTPVTLTLNFNQTADLDIYVLRENENGDYDPVDGSFARQGISERLSLNLPAGNYIIAVGAFSGSSQYALTLQQGFPSALLRTTPPEPFSFRYQTNKR
jgi:uncharacterized protein (TIGR03437 family)